MPVCPPPLSDVLHALAFLPLLGQHWALRMEVEMELVGRSPGPVDPRGSGLGASFPSHLPSSPARSCQGQPRLRGIRGVDGG